MMQQPISPEEIARQAINPDPTIWDKYLIPAFEGITNAPVIGPALRGIGQGLEWLQEEVINPPVTEMLQYLPVGWETTATPPEDFGIAPWNEAWWKLKSGNPTLDLDAFTKFVPDEETGGTKRQLVPSAILDAILAPTIGAAQSWFKGPTPTPGTERARELNEAILALEAQTGNDATDKQRMALLKEIQQLPPFLRGAAEDLPYWFVPSAKATQIGLRASRVGKTMKALEKVSPPTSKAVSEVLEGAAKTLEPLKRVEDLTEAAVKKAVSPIGKVLPRGFVKLDHQGRIKLYKQLAEDENELLDQGHRYIDEKDNIEKLLTAQHSLDSLNEMVKETLGIREKLYEIRPTRRGERIFRNKTPIPQNVAVRWQKDITGEDSVLTTASNRLRSMKPRDVPELSYTNRQGKTITAKKLVEEARKDFQTGFHLAGNDPDRFTVRWGARGNIISRKKTIVPDERFETRRISAKTGEPIKGRVIDFEDHPWFSRPFDTKETISLSRVKKANPENKPADKLDEYKVGNTVEIQEKLGLQLSNKQQEKYNELLEDYLETAEGYNSEAAAHYRLELDRLNSHAGDAVESQTSFLDIELNRPIRADGFVNEQWGSAFTRLDELSAPRMKGWAANLHKARQRKLEDGIDWTVQDRVYPIERYATSEAAIDMHRLAKSKPYIIKDFTGKSRQINELGPQSELANRIVDYLSPGSSDWFIKNLFRFHDSSTALRVLQDDYFRSIDPQAAFKAGSHRDVLAGVMLASGAPLRGFTKYEEFMKGVVLRQLVEADNVTEWDVEKLLLKRHFDEIHNATGGVRNKDKMPRVWNKEKEEFVEGNEYLGWEKEVQEKLSESDWAIANNIAEEVRDQYRKFLDDDVAEGIITAKFRDELNDEYKWYNPIDILDYHEKDATIFARGTMSVRSTGIMKLSRDADISDLAMSPPIGEVLAKRFVVHELRIHRNRTTKAFAQLAGRSKIGIVDVTNKLVKQKHVNPKGQVWDKDKSAYVSAQTLETVSKTNKELYDETLQSGFLTFYENGQRKIYGSIDSRGHAVPIDKAWWDTLNGRAGLNVRSDLEVENIFAAANSFFKSTYTTFDPLFMIGNGLIDQLVVGLRYRILPTTIWMRLAKDITNKASQGEIRFKNLMELQGVRGTYYETANRRMRAMQKEVDRIGKKNTASKNATDGAVVMDATQVRAISKVVADSAAKRMKPLAKLGNAIRTTGEIVEQTPRLIVGERTFKRLVGKAEWDRLMKLSKEDWNREVYSNWNNTGRGLVDSPELKQAAMNAIEATINFGRGGDQIRRWNNYLMFLNASFEGAKLPFRMLGIDLTPTFVPRAGATVGGRQFGIGSWRPKMGKRRGVTGTYDDPLGVSFLDKQIGPRGTAAITVSMAMTTYAGLHLGYNFQHAEYWDIPMDIRYNSLVFMLPAETDEDGVTLIDPSTGRPKPRYITIPHRLRELSLFFGTITYLLESSFTEHPTDWGDFIGQVWNASSPVSDLPLPQVVSRGAEEMFGYDLYRGREIENPEYAHLPVDERHNSYTSESARIISERLGNSDWLPDIMKKSPQRVEHLYENIFGGVGKRALDLTDYAILLIEDLRKAEDRPMKEHVKEYRNNMTQLERSEFLAFLERDQREAFEKELRRPVLAEGNIVDQIFDATGLGPRFSPNRGGGIKETQIRAAEEVMPNVSAKQSAKLATQLRQFDTEMQALGYENDQKLADWEAKDTATLTASDWNKLLSPTDWIKKNRQDYFAKQGALLISRYQNPEAVQWQDDATKRRWYEAYYTAGGTMPDLRSQVDELVTGFYNIPFPGDDNASPTLTMAESFRNQDEYILAMQELAETNGEPEVYNEFIRSLDKKLRPREKEYKQDMRYLSEWYDAGSTLDSLLGAGASTEYPELELKWQSYLAADSATKNHIRSQDTQINNLVNRRINQRKIIVRKSWNTERYPRMDFLLAYWRGGNYTPISPLGINVKSKLYGGSGLEAGEMEQYRNPELGVGVD